MSTDLIKRDEAEEVEGTVVDGDSLQEEITSLIIVDITYFVNPQEEQGKGNDEGDAESQGEGESENSVQQESQEGENNDDKAEPYEPGENQDDKSNNGDSSVKTETGAEVYSKSDVFVQVQTKDRTLVGR